MRKLYNQQKSLFCQWSKHQFSRELEVISEILEELPELLSMVFTDLQLNVTHQAAGSHGMTAEQVLRAAILKQQNAWSYKFLSLQCVDSLMSRSFLKLDFDEYYSPSCLQENIAKIRSVTWEKINKAIINYSFEQGIEKGRTIRLDSTAIDSNVHYPSDSSLIFDCQRVIDRIVKKIRKKSRMKLYMPDSLIETKRIVLKIKTAKKKEQVELYRQLLQIANRTLDLLPKIIEANQRIEADKKGTLSNLMTLLPIIIKQTRRRVLKGEQVPAEEKILSIFEPHTDLIAKGQREIQYGHKVFLSAGKSGIITNCQLVQANPADSEFFMDLLENHKNQFGKMPRQISADGGFSSLDNLLDAQELGVKDVCFSKSPGIAKEEMVKSPWVFQKLRNFRAGIEGIISTLKRGFGLSKVTWKGVSGFASYVHSAIVAYNLSKLAQIKLS